MTKKAPARTNEYYLERLRLERPDIHDDLAAGRLANPAEAFKLAGLKKPRTRLQELKNAWVKASPSERDAFKAHIGCLAVPTGPPSSLRSSSTFSIDRRLTPSGVAQVQAIMLRRGLKMAVVLDELGFKRLNPSLGLALRQNNRLQPDMIDALKEWIAADLVSTSPP